MPQPSRGRVSRQPPPSQRAAVDYAKSGSAEDREALLARVDERALAGVGRYDGLLGGTIGDRFDEPDVAAFVSSLT